MGCKLFHTGHETAGSLEQPEMLPSGSVALFDFLPEAVLGHWGSAAHLGQKENSLCEISAWPGSEMETANSYTELQQRIVSLQSPMLMCSGGKSAAVSTV